MIHFHRYRGYFPSRYIYLSDVTIAVQPPPNHYVEPIFDKYLITFPIHQSPMQSSSTWGCQLAIVYCIFFPLTQVTQSVRLCVQCPRSCIVKTRIQNI